MPEEKDSMDDVWPCTDDAWIDLWVNGWRLTFETSICHHGVYVIRHHETKMVVEIEGLGDPNLGSPGYAALCVFKTDADADEYRFNRLSEPEIWEVYGTYQLKGSLELLRWAQESYTHVAVNPPLKNSKRVTTMTLPALIERFRSRTR